MFRIMRASTETRALSRRKRDITDVYHVVVTAIDSKGRISHH